MKSKLANIESNTGRFVDGNPSTGTLGTIVTAQWLNAVQERLQDTYEELKGVLDLANIPVNVSRTTQLADAINALLRSEWDSNVRCKFTIFRNQAITLDASKRSDWVREMQMGSVLNRGYYTQSFFGTSANPIRTYLNFPIETREHFTAELFNQAGFSHLKLTYPSLKRAFETAINLNNEDLVLDWRESVYIKDGVYQGAVKATGGLESAYRVRAARDDSHYPYLQVVNLNYDLAAPPGRNRIIGSVDYYVKDGDSEKSKATVMAAAMPDKNAFWELALWDASQVRRVAIKAYSKTNNVTIGKSQDNERDTLQVNGTVQATAPEASANNDQVPTTAWVRGYGVGQTGNQSINGQLNVGRANEWKKLGFPSGNGEFIWEAHPQAAQATPNSVRFNIKFIESGQDVRYISFPEFGSKNEIVAYRSWVESKAEALGNTKVSKTGDTMTGRLVVPQIEVTQNNSGGKNIKIGDDVWIGDDAVHHGFKVKSQGDESKGFIAFGNRTTRLGRGINYNPEDPFLEWEGNYLSLNARNDEFAGIDVVRKGDRGNFLMRMEPLWDKRWKFWTEGSHEVFLPARSGTVALESDLRNVSRTNKSRSVQHPQRANESYTTNGSVTIYPDGRIVQIFHLVAIRPAWFDLEVEGLGLNGERHRNIPIQLWTAMPNKIEQVHSQLMTATSGNTTTYRSESAEWRTAWQLRNNAHERNWVNINAARILGHGDEPVDLYVVVEGY